MPRNRPSNVIAVYQDITERKQAHEQIVRLNAELEQRVMDAPAVGSRQRNSKLSATRCPDLRTLRGIDGFNRLLLQYGNHLDKTGSGYLRASPRHQRMEELIDDLLELSKVGDQTKPAQVDLSQLARSILAEIGA